MMGVGTLLFTNHMPGEAKGTIHKTLDAVTVLTKWPLVEVELYLIPLSFQMLMGKLLRLLYTFEDTKCV